MLLTEQQMIAKINTIISQSGLGPEYKVYKIRAANWGIIAYWTPPGADKSVNAMPYLCHKNGIVKDYGDVAHRNNLHPVTQANEIIKCFINEAERRTIN